MSNKQNNDFLKGDNVMYIPHHAQGDQGHPDCECGKVSSTNDHFVFVKFNKQLTKFGWNGTTSQSCHQKDLIHID